MYFIHDRSRIMSLYLFYQIIEECVCVAAIPASVMFIGSAFAIYSPRQPSKNVIHAVQHLAAGILLCAISSELIPTIAEAKGTENLIGIIVGFTVGAIVMTALPWLLEETDKGEESHHKLHDDIEGGVNSKVSEKLCKSASANGMTGTVFLRRMKSKVFHMLEGIQDKGISVGDNNPCEPFPAVFAIAVYIDSAMDGLLVGI